MRMQQNVKMQPTNYKHTENVRNYFLDHGTTQLCILELQEL